MSMDAFRNFRSWMCSSSTITTLVPRASIKIGWPRQLNTFPSIVITQSTGVDIGYLGYGTSIAGNRVRKEEVTFQVDIFSRDSRRQTYQISDAIIPVLIASGGCTKNSDTDLYEDDLEAYRKTQSYSFIMHHDD